MAENISPEQSAVAERPLEKIRVAKREYPGALVVVEGIDGSGKSTQLYLLKRWLEIGGYRIHFTEWNSSPLVRSATRRGKQRRLLTPVTFSLLHAADFADRCERQILPLLHGGYLVLADRYIYTAFSRDVARGCSPQSCAFRDHFAELQQLGVAHLFGLSTQSTEYQHEAAERLELPFPLLSDERLSFASAIGLPSFETSGMTLLKRCTLVIDDGTIEHVFYPVFPPDRNAGDVVAWLTANPR